MNESCHKYERIWIRVVTVTTSLSPSLSISLSLSQNLLPATPVEDPIKTKRERGRERESPRKRTQGEKVIMKRVSEMDGVQVADGDEPADVPVCHIMPKATHRVKRDTCYVKRDLYSLKRDYLYYVLTQCHSGLLSEPE